MSYDGKWAGICAAEFVERLCRTYDITLSCDDVGIVGQLVQAYLNDAVKHGFMLCSQAVDEEHGVPMAHTISKAVGLASHRARFRVLSELSNWPLTGDNYRDLQDLIDHIGAAMNEMGPEPKENPDE